MDQRAEAPKMSSDEFKVRLQMETSLLVWVRTSLALMGFGFVVARFGLFLREMAQASGDHIKPHAQLAAMNTSAGAALMALGVLVLILSVLNHRRLVDGLERGELSMPLRWSLGVILSLVLAVLGTVMAIYLMAVEL